MAISAPHSVDVLPEPLLQFGYSQSSPNPKEGLFLFGPLREPNNPVDLRCGVVGTPKGIAGYRAWVTRLSRAVLPQENSTTSVFYPGFSELFNCTWSPAPVAELPISAHDISTALHRSDRHDAIHATVSLFADAIVRFANEDDRRVDIWFVAIPDEVFELGRPKSVVPKEARVQSEHFMNARLAKKLLSRGPSLFPEDNKAAEAYLYDLDFHNQLKARLIQSRAITQIVRESTLIQDTKGASTRRLQDAASIAWNLSVSSYYKAGGRPWRLQDIREDVCYVGLVFKRDSRAEDESYACCGAQMFLTSGEGMVFKGTPGRWYSPTTKEFHLSKEQATEIACRVIAAYKAAVGRPPAELFIHGRTKFNHEEWEGFQAAMPAGTRVSGIRITRTDEFKLFRPGRMPVIRGTVATETDRVAYLWTSGFVPELSTYPGWEVPNPLRIEINRGEAQLPVVVSDVFQLTKLNFNACIYGDGLPVTLRFADAIGEILTAAPDIPEAPLPFRHYI